MKAVRFHAYGPPDGLTVDTVPDPMPAPGEVIVEVAAAGINPLDWKIRSGALQAMLPLELPYILGSDVCGTVKTVGAGVAALRPGDKVLGMLPAGRPGAYADLVAAAADILVAWPVGLSQGFAATLPVVALTANQAVHREGEFRSGMTLLVVGASGVVGGLARQLAARVPDAEILAAVRKDHADALDGPRSRTVFTDGDGLAELGRTVDVVIDTVGGPLQDQAMRTLRPNGRLVTTVQPPNADTARALDVEARMMMVQPDPEALAGLAQDLAAGRLAVPDPKAFPLAEAARAHAEGEARAFAKGVLLP